MSDLKKLTEQIKRLKEANPEQALQYIKEIPPRIRKDSELYENRDFLEKLRKDLVSSLPEGYIKASDFSNAMTPVKDISEEELWDLYDRFHSLPIKDREKYEIGSGIFKRTYAFPDSPLVIKKARSEFSFPSGDVELGGNVVELPAINPKKDRAEQTLINDYLEHKLTNKYLPKDKKIIETPILLKKPEGSTALVQRKLILPKSIRDFVYRDIQGKIDPTLFEAAKNLEDADFKEVFLSGLEERVIPRDTHSGNVGLDPITLKPKVFDTMASQVVSRESGIRNFANKLKKILETTTSPRIYRSAMPLLAKGAAIGAGGLASLAAEASDAEEEGSAPEEAAMQREAIEAKFKKAIGKEAYEAGQKNLEQTSPMHLLNRYAKLREKLK